MVTKSNSRRALALLVVMAALGLAACTSHAHRGASSGPQGTGPTGTTVAPSTSGSGHTTGPVALPSGTSGRPYWLMEDFSIRPLLNAGLSQSLLQQYFNNPQTFLIFKHGLSTSDPLLPQATVVNSFASYQQMRQAVLGGSIPSNVKYLLYDNEKWQATPKNEQHSPISYAAQAEALAHQHGYGLIFTPAANLSTVLATTYDNSTKYSGYLALGLATQGARVSDVFEIQAQQDQGFSSFVSFATSAATEARHANPKALVLLGLTTSAPSTTVTGQSLLGDYNATRSTVDGYWLNIPGGGSGGPREPGVAVSFLQALAPSLGYSG